MGISKTDLKKIEGEARKYFQGLNGCHDWSHVDRVRKLALKIGRSEGADLRVLEAAALLHDIGRKAEDESKGQLCHAEKSSDDSRKILKKFAISAKDRENILHSILSHRFRNNHEPETKEAKILFDADKLDSIGAIGIGRDFQFAGEIGAKLYNSDRANVHKTAAYSEEDTAYREYAVKLSKIKDRMLTGAGKRLARDRHRFMVAFFKRFWQEADGKK